MGFQCRKEPSLVEILDDPIVQELMESDGVQRASLELLISNMRAKRSEAEVNLSAYFW